MSPDTDRHCRFCGKALSAKAKHGVCVQCQHLARREAERVKLAALRDYVQTCRVELDRPGKPTNRPAWMNDFWQWR